MVTTSESNRSETDPDIAGIVRSHWSATGRVLLLSTLGQLISKTRNLQQFLDGKSLKDVVESEYGEQVQIVQKPGNPLILGLAPRAENLPSDTSELFRKKDSVSTPRYKPAVWSAFTRPIQDGYVRALSVTCDEFSDIAANQPTFDFTIGPDDLPQVDQTRETWPQVSAAITDWAKRKNIDQQKLLAGGKSDSHRQPATASRTTLDVMLEMLTEDQLRRCSLPLDVIKKLLQPSR